MHGSDLGRLRVDPSASIARAVKVLSVYELDGERPHLGIPHPEIDLVVRSGPGVRGGIDAHAFGARDRIHRKTPRGVKRTVSARLHLGATLAVLGVPASQIAGRVVALEDLWGPTATRRLFDQLSSVHDATESAKVLDAAIAERLGEARARAVGSSLARDAASMLGRSPVSSVADELGVSGRHLRRVFQEDIGIGPKAFAKLERFQRALHAARDGEGLGWAHVAVSAGYYDQAHLIAEFRAIAGTTPCALLKELQVVSMLS